MVLKSFDGLKTVFIDLVSLQLFKSADTSLQELNIMVDYVGLTLEDEVLQAFCSDNFLICRSEMWIHWLQQ